jgi:hypothetical protein
LVTIGCAANRKAWAAVYLQHIKVLDICLNLGDFLVIVAEYLAMMFF